MVERSVHIGEVAGSIPAASTKFGSGHGGKVTGSIPVEPTSFNLFIPCVFYCKKYDYIQLF